MISSWMAGTKPAMGLVIRLDHYGAAKRGFHESFSFMISARSLAMFFVRLSIAFWTACTFLRSRAPRELFGGARRGERQA